MNIDVENEMGTSTADERDANRLTEKTRALTKRAKVAAQYTDDYVHESPWVAVGAAVATGVLLGLLFGRSR
jgi:ElaB/YqjD/DUF883 family membrane-anchored ribosome-binding protein